MTLVGSPALPFTLLLPAVAFSAASLATPVSPSIIMTLGKLHYTQKCLVWLWSAHATGLQICSPHGASQPQLHHGFLTRSKWAAGTARHYSVGRLPVGRLVLVAVLPSCVNTPLLSCSVLHGVLVGGASRACLWRLQHPPSAMDDGSVSEFMSLQHPSSVRSPQPPRAPVRPFSHVPRRCGCVRLSGCICACMCLCLLCVCGRCMGDRRCWRLQGCWTHRCF